MKVSSYSCKYFGPDSSSIRSFLVVSGQCRPRDTTSPVDTRLPTVGLTFHEVPLVFGAMGSSVGFTLKVLVRLGTMDRTTSL